MNTDGNTDAVRAIQKRIGSTPFPDGFQSIADDASTMIDTLFTKLAEVTAEREEHEGARILNRSAINYQKARAEAAEAMLPAAYRAGVEAASDHILKTQIGSEEKGNYWIKGNNSGVKGSAHAIRALPTPTIEQLKEMMKENSDETK